MAGESVKSSGLGRSQLCVAALLFPSLRGCFGFSPSLCLQPCVIFSRFVKC